MHIKARQKGRRRLNSRKPTLANGDRILKKARCLSSENRAKNGKYHSYKGEVGKVANNLLNRDFYADKPFEKLTTDVTKFKAGDEKVYLSPVLDMFNREIVSYSISTSPNLQQVRDMLMVCLKSFLLMLDLYSIPTKAGNTNTPNINGYLPNTTLHKACPERVIVWTTA